MSSSSIQNLDHLKIPLDDILEATNHFSNENFVKQSGFGTIYKGKLKRSEEMINIVARRLDTKHEQGSKQFMTEILMLSKLEHENLVSLVGFCDEKNEKIVINKYEAKGSLDNYITDASITWGKRLHICVGIAHALRYIYYDEKRDFSVVHRNIKSSKILLDYFFVPKLSGFEHSTTTNVASQSNRLCVDDACGSTAYVDPTYVKTGTVTHKSDIYSFGVILFELLLGKKAITDNKDTKLAQEAKSHYVKGKLNDLINPVLRKQMNEEALEIISETAYACLYEDRERRPDINQVVMKLKQAMDHQREHANKALRFQSGQADPVRQELKNRSSDRLEDLKIPLKDILEATNHFSNKNFIRQGGFGKIYKGKLKRSGALIDIVARRLDTSYGQGSKQFWTEILMLSKLEHENLISIVGFCDEKNLKIVVNKYEAKGSLDNYLSDSTITWLNRLQICVGAARALNYIHYDEKRNFSVIHRNIKSSKILLDYSWIPKLSGFELSMTTVASRRDRLCIEDACGSTGYFDPTYIKTGSVSHKSDIYSFGVILFEVLFGKKAITDNRDMKLAKEAKFCYENKQLDDLINPDLRKQMDRESLKIFSEIAYDCLKEYPAGRPNIHQVIMKLEKALDFQQRRTNKELYLRRAHMLGESTSGRTPYDGKGLNLEHLNFRFYQIKYATNAFAHEYCIQVSSSFKVYKAQLDIVDSKYSSEIEGETNWVQSSKISYVAIKRYTHINRDFFMAEKGAHVKHRKLVSILGSCSSKKNMIIVYEHPSNGSLADHLRSTNNITYFTWVQRLRICIDIAHGLNYIHSNPKCHTKKIHRTISSSNILLKENWEAVIGRFSEFELPVSYRTTGNWLTDRLQIDTFNFGIVLFEILCWRFANDPIYLRNDKGLVSFVRRCFKDGTQSEILDLKLVGEAEKDFVSKGIDQNSLETFSKVAYQCLGEDDYQLRPTPELVLNELKKALYLQESQEEKNNLQISLADIKLATQNFSYINRIGQGGFGQVYKGELLWAGGHQMIAAKRLDIKSDQGETELMTELVILSEYKHMNVIDLVSYCTENGEKVIVYDYAAKGSLDRWLKSEKLTWKKRLEICIDIARGLDFLHGTSDVKREVVIHRDIKSANILLHDDWKASIADFGLSLISPLNQDINYVIDNVKGTLGYCDPIYLTTGFLTKESDIYSVGVLFFEMLCGRFVIEDKNSRADNLVELVRNHYIEGSLYEIVFEATKRQMAPKSFTTFLNIAYQCIHEKRSKRPTACDVLIQLQKALESQDKWEDLNISLDDIMLDTQDFSHENLIDESDFWSVYKGRVTCADGCKIIAAKRLDRQSDQRKTEHMAELEVLLEYTHENIISLVGHCDEKGEKITVYEYSSISKGSLDRWLKYDDLTWRKRLEICIDIAKGLAFLHGTSGAKQEVVIHGDIKSATVLLNDDWSAIIAGFGCSLISPINQEMKYVVNKDKGTPGYCDPLYTTTGVLTKESDIYSFGVLLFEMLCGRFVMEHNSSGAQNLVDLVRPPFEEGALYQMVFDATKKQMAPKSLTTFLNIAYQCLHEERSKRPTANDVLVQLKKSLALQAKIEHLNISFDDIMLATQDFSLDNLIGKGGSGPVYKGQVTSAHGCEIIAVKCLDRITDQRETERVTELEVLLEYKHENIIALLGFCNEKRENIMVYEYADKGSLDRWLRYDALTWRKRLEICIDIATGLTFLHGTSGEKQDVVIHRNIKSKNILLHGDWKAKIAYFGYSLMSPINQETKYVVNNAKGTPGYCDPLYTTTGVLTKESDIYSFGVLLFEMLCGRFVMEDNSSKAQNLVHMVRHHFEEGKLSEMVFETLKKQIVPESLTTFQNIAYKCIREERAKRPTASDVLIQLYKALDFQVEIEIWEPKLPRDLGKIIQMTYSPEFYYAMSNKDICTSLHKGFLLREDRVWFSLGTNGRRVEVISATEFYFKRYFGPDKWIRISESRFGPVAWISDSSKMNIRFKIKPQLLSPGVNYRVDLLFKFCDPRENLDTCIDLKYHIGNKFLLSHCTTERDDGWLTKELFQFSSLAEEADIDVFLLGFSGSHYVNRAVYIKAMEFKAIENMAHEEMEELKRLSIANGKKSPTDEGHWKVNMAEVQELPANESGHVFAIVPWLLEKCCG